MKAAHIPRTPGEPVPSVPPVEQPDGAPFRYGGFLTAFIAARIGISAKLFR
jgi:hypothetical protein